MPSNMVQLHRVLRTTPEKIYKAFLEPDALVKWLPPDGITCKVYQLDPKVGGKYHIVQEGIPAAIPTEMCYLGWQESLVLLAKLVEPEIKP